MLLPASPPPHIVYQRLPARSNVSITVEATTTFQSWLPIARSTGGTPFAPLIDGVTCEETTLDPSRVSVTVSDSPSPACQRYLRIAVTR